MQYQSREVDSPQHTLHTQLFKVLGKHRETSYRRPIPAYSQDIFEQLEKTRRTRLQSIIVDAGCGTGSATRILARTHPHALVIGVDKSAHRLARGGISQSVQNEANCLFVRMDLVDFWQLACRHEWQLEKHYLLYPNPWPKTKHLRRRWHGHPVFPTLLKLGGELEMRCNWRVYAEEFQAAVNYFRPASCLLDEYQGRENLSLFEQKYRGSGHVLYRCNSAAGCQ